jgi:hypothetical protein
MTKERPPSMQRNPYQIFGLAESKILYYRTTHKRFLEMLQDPETKIHEVKESGNAYGDLLFVIVSRSLPSELAEKGLDAVPELLRMLLTRPSKRKKPNFLMLLSTVFSGT